MNDAGLTRLGFESDYGIPGHDLTFTRFKSETLEVERPDEPDPNQDPSGNETAGENLLARGQGNLVVAPNTESLLKMRIAQHGYYTKTSPAAGVHLWELREELDGDDPLTHHVASLHAGIWRDEKVDPCEYNITGAEVNEFTLKVDANKHVEWDHNLLFLRDRYMRNPTPNAVDPALTGDLFSRGHRSLANDDDDVLKFKFTDAGAFDGTAKFVTAKGVAGVYGATEYPLIAGTWTDFLVGGLHVGTRDEPVQILIVPEVGSVATIDDEFYIYPTSPKPVPAYSARPKLRGTALDLRFSWDEGVTWVTKVINTFEIKLGTPKAHDFGLGSKYAQQIKKADNARRSCQVSFNRNYVDRDFRKALINGQRIQAFARFYGGYIGATTYEDYSEYDIPVLRFTQAGATRTRSGDLPETVVLRAEPANQGDPLCYERHQNTIASVAPS